MLKYRDNENKASLRQLAKWTWQHSKGSQLRISMACLMGFLRVAASMIFIWVSKRLVDVATGGTSSIEHIWHLSGILAGLMASEILFSLAMNYIGCQTEIRVKNDLRYRIYSHLLSGAWGETRRIHSGDLINRLNEDTRVITEAICRKLPQTIVMVVQLLAAFVFLYVMSPLLALCIVGITPFFLLLSKLYIMKMRRITAEIRTDDSLIQSNIQEGIQHNVVVRTLESEPFMLSRLKTLHQRLYLAIMRRTRFSTFSRAMVNAGFVGGYLTAFIWSVWHLHYGLITFGSMTAFLQLVARIQNPMSNLTSQIPSFVHATTSIDRLMELEALPAENKSISQKITEPVGIRFDNVSFRYIDGSYNILENFSHNFLPGSKTVIMGETGIGKSTLVRLILALYKPQKGLIDIYNDATNMEVSPDTRCNIVYVPQGNSLLEGSIRDNLLLGNPNATDEMMQEALHTAVADFVYNLPLGLDTPCGELGAGLSEGQAQRIAIARALLRCGSIMLLDEFNSSLDEATAATLMQRLTAARPASTIIFISHRTEVTSYCDEIVHLSQQANEFHNN